MYFSFKLIGMNTVVRNCLMYSTYKQLCEEIKIPVPWGHIAGKWWGAQDKRPILLLHGWQDNCGSFDRIIPLLNPRLGYLAIDFPGHGLSSTLPTGVSYYWTDYVIFLHRIVQYFNWSRVSLFGHSVGGATAYTYATLYPKTVDFLITIDMLKPITRDIDMAHMGKQINDFLKYDNLLRLNKEGPSYTFQELERRLYENSNKSISLDVCKYILRRDARQSTTKPNQFYLTKDLRLKVRSFLNFNCEEVMNNIDKLICPTLTCVASQQFINYEGATHTPQFYKIVQKTKNNFEMYVVEGTHHLHLNNPECVAGFVNNFIKKYDVEDRTDNGFKKLDRSSREM